jgi:acyl-CoA thioester hydrolase
MSIGTGDRSQMDLASLYFSPFVSSVMRVEPQWIDYNGHMDLAHFNGLFDRAMAEVFTLCGLGPDYVEERQQSFFVVESRTSYRQELTEGDTVRVTVQVIDVDDKRVHCYMEIRHALDGWVAASAEKLVLHVDLNFRRATIFPADIRRNLEELRDAHAEMPRPEKLGQAVSMPQKVVMN